jgi:hypothetical protein
VNCEEIDWPGLRAAAVAIGIRKAARHAARDLPPNEQARFIQRAMKRYWEIIADNLSKAGWSLGWVSALDVEGRTI